jgi:GNAT superfamily N-acetyltransferase
MTESPSDDGASRSMMAAGSDGAIVREARDGDVPALLQMFAELAEYEHLTHELRATADDLDAALFGPSPAARALVAERGARAIGYALFFPTFSSFLASRGVWLEDLYVRPAHRGVGVGRALLAAVAAHARDAGSQRLEWTALDWNEPALRFYRGLGAATMGEWVNHRLTGDRLERLAGEHSGESHGEHARGGSQGDRADGPGAAADTAGEPR